MSHTHKPPHGEAGPLPADLDAAHHEIERLREDCAAIYQAVGALASSAGLFETDSARRLLDYLWAAANGETRPGEPLLPFPLPHDTKAFEQPQRGKNRN
jgi:hypothetical protein